MKDYFVCKKLSNSNSDFCSLYGHWDSVKKGKCKKCKNNKKCETCCNKETIILSDGKKTYCCDICENRIS